MLDILNAVAERLRRVGWVFWLVLIVSVVGFLGTVTGLLALSDAYAILFLVTTMWALTLLVVVGCFPRPIPEPGPDAGLGERVASRLSYVFTWLLGAATVLASVAVIVTTLKLAGIFASQLAK